MKAAGVIAFVLACALAATVAGTTAAMSTAAQAKKKHHAPKFNPRYNCSKAAQTKIVNAFLASWEGHLAIKGKVYNSASAHGGSSACTYKHADGPFAGQWAGSLYIEYGSKAARSYAGDDHTAKTRGAQACANGNPSGDPRACGPVEIAGVGKHAYEAFFYVATLKRKVFVTLQAGSGVANGQWIPSSTLPPQDALAGAAKAILAKLP